MDTYMQVDIVNSDEINNYLSKGWEIIETIKINTDCSQFETRINYHIGLSAKVMVDKLITIIKDSEEHDLKKKLYEYVAESFDEKSINNRAISVKITPTDIDLNAEFCRSEGDKWFI